MKIIFFLTNREFTNKNNSKILFKFYRLYLTTSLGNPHFLPAVSNNVTIIDFTVTFDGLQEQLLSNVVKQVNHYPIDGVFILLIFRYTV